jgi:spore photoproduct lyase
LASYKGDLLKPCPGTKGYICCGYKILNIGTDCPLDCSYCILQAYFSSSFLRVFVNFREELIKVTEQIKRNPDQIFRMGTGEFTDSLALDPIIKWSEWLVPSFSGLKNAVLELKTKTTQIEGILSSSPRDRIILSWSLNSPVISTKEELGASSLKKRILAAKKCQEEGFAIGFHFDPIISHPYWKEEYQRTIELLAQYIDPKGIIWISLGSMRYMPKLKEIIRQRHPKSHILDGEFVMGRDGKMRYFKPIRIELYSEINRLLRQWSGDPAIYLCMESDEIWDKSMGWSPKNSSGLRRYLDNRVKSFFH